MNIHDPRVGCPEYLQARVEGLLQLDWSPSYPYNLAGTTYEELWQQFLETPTDQEALSIVHGIFALGERHWGSHGLIEEDLRDLDFAQEMAVLVWCSIRRQPRIDYWLLVQEIRYIADTGQSITVVNSTARDRSYAPRYERGRLLPELCAFAAHHMQDRHGRVRHALLKLWRVAQEAHKWENLGRGGS